MKIEQFDEELNKHGGRLEWIESCLYSALGFKANPEMPDREGNIDKKIRILNEDIKGNGRMGIKTRVMILWFSLPILTSVIGFLIGLIVKGYVK